jgi:beta-xylosidase
MGRQGMLSEVIWDESSGWPHFKDGITPPVQSEMPFSRTLQQRDSIYYDDFLNDTNLKFWQWDLTKPKPGINILNGLLTLSSAQKEIAFAGISPKTGNFSFEANLTRQTDDLNGICVYGNSKNLLSLAVSGSKLVLFQLKNGEKETLAECVIPENSPVFLKMEATHGRFYRFFWSDDQKNWIPVKIQNEYTMDGNFLPQWGVAMRTGLLIHGKSGSFSLVKMKNLYE